MVFLVDPRGRSQPGHIRILPANPNDYIYNFMGKCPRYEDVEALAEYAETTARRLAEDFADQVMSAPGWTDRCSRDELVEELLAEWLKLQAERVLDLKKYL